MMTRRAFTLLEIVLVMALIVILAALVFPSLAPLYRQYRTDAALDAVRAAWANARSEAIDAGQPYRFAVIYGTGNYRLAPDSSAYWGNTGEIVGLDEAALLGGRPPVVIEGTLPKEVIFVQGNGTAQTAQTEGMSAIPAGSASVNQYVPVGVFLPDGTSREDMQVVIQPTDGMPWVVSQRSLTGAVTVSRIGPEGGW